MRTRTGWTRLQHCLTNVTYFDNKCVCSYLTRTKFTILTLKKKSYLIGHLVQNYDWQQRSLFLLDFGSFFLTIEVEQLFQDCHTNLGIWHPWSKSWDSAQVFSSCAFSSLVQESGVKDPLQAETKQSTTRTISNNVQILIGETNICIYQA